MTIVVEAYLIIAKLSCFQTQRGLKIFMLLNDEKLHTSSEKFISEINAFINKVRYYNCNLIEIKIPDLF